MTHGINVGYDHFTDSQIFWDHLEKVKKQEGQIWVGTFRDVAAYVKARKSLKYSIAETAKGFVVRPEIQLDPKLFTVPLTGVIDRSVINKVSVVQQNKKLKTRILKDKILFDFNPFGGDIIVTIK